ncbi:MAG: tagaturonate reductase, partial [Eubacteriales bacterium]
MNNKVIQFGEGGFLRGFADWMLQCVNERTDFNGGVAVVQPIEKGMCATLEEQNGSYHLIMRGIENGRAREESKLIDVIKSCINPYEDYEAYLALAENPDFRFVISNTTEAGIAYHAGDRLSDRPPCSFPAKVCALL